MFKSAFSTILNIAFVAFLFFLASCSKENIEAASHETPLDNTTIETRNYPLSNYTFALTKTVPSELYMIDPVSGDNLGNQVRFYTPGGAIVPVVTGITFFQGIVINGQHNYDTYYVALGDNSAALANPAYSHHIWSVHIDVLPGGGIASATLSQMVVSTNGLTITDLCWSDFTFQGYGCGPVGLIEGSQDQMMYFDLYNNLDPVIIQINHMFTTSEHPEGLAWIYDPAPPCGVSSSIPYARLMLTTHSSAGNTSKVNIYELEFSVVNNAIAVVPVLTGFIDIGVGTNPGNGIGWLTGHNSFFVGLDPNSTQMPPGGVKVGLMDYCNINTIQSGGNLQFPASPIMQPIQDFMTIKEWDPNQL